MLDGERIPGKFSPVEPLNRVGTARCAVRAAFSGAIIPPAVSRAGTSQRDVPTTVRFMGWKLNQVQRASRSLVFDRVDVNGGIGGGPALSDAGGAAIRPHAFVLLHLGQDDF